MKIKTKRYGKMTGRNSCSSHKLLNQKLCWITKRGAQDITLYKLHSLIVAEEVK